MKELTAEQEYYYNAIKEYYSYLDIKFYIDSYIDIDSIKTKLRRILIVPLPDRDEKTLGWYNKYSWISKLL
jgi:hypothetical protein